MNKKQLISAVSVSLIIIVGAFAYYLLNKHTTVFTVQARSTNHQQIGGAVQKGKSSSLITVYIVGAVKTPGVYKVKVGTRLYELVDCAGGFLPGADVVSLNLARRLHDGEKIVVTKKDSRSKGKSFVYKKGTTALSGKIDINTASVEELKRLPGVGPKIAQRIVDYRNAHGGFRSPQELIRVKGIGKKKLKKMLPFVVVR